MKIQDDEQQQVGLEFDGTCTKTEGDRLNLRRAD